MKIISPSIARLEKSLEICAKVLKLMSCKSVHVDVSVDIHLPGFYGKEILASGELELFDCPATVHIFPGTTLEGIDFGGVRKYDRIMLHIFPQTNHNQISMLMESAARIGFESAVALDIGSEIDIVAPFVLDLKAIYIMGIPVATHSLPPNELTRIRMKIMREIMQSKNPSCVLGIDGGINNETFANMAMLADEIVVGGLLFNAPNIYSQWEALNNWLEKINGGTA